MLTLLRVRRVSRLRRRRNSTALPARFEERALAAFVLDENRDLALRATPDELSDGARSAEAQIF
jgi:hypothetical protein